MLQKQSEIQNFLDWNFKFTGTENVPIQESNIFFGTAHHCQVPQIALDFKIQTDTLL